MHILTYVHDCLISMCVFSYAFVYVLTNYFYSSQAPPPTSTTCFLSGGHDLTVNILMTMHGRTHAVTSDVRT